jgi:FkbH-like protein
MQAVLEPIHEGNITRVTQLINKTNQFNLTTRRMTEADVRRAARDPEVYTSTTRLRDRFGDHGLISVVIGHAVDNTFQIDSWLMSCRVLKRGVELLEFDRLLTFCRTRSLGKICGLYVPTSKNKLVEKHYAMLGFSEVSGDEKGRTWIYNVIHSKCPAYHITVEEGTITVEEGTQCAIFEQSSNKSSAISSRTNLL